MSTGREIRLVENEDGWWTARDVTAEVTSQGATKADALDSLEAAVAVAAGETGRPPTDEELREAGIDPADNTTGDRELPDVLK